MEALVEAVTVALDNEDAACDGSHDALRSCLVVQKIWKPKKMTFFNQGAVVASSTVA